MEYGVCGVIFLSGDVHAEVDMVGSTFRLKKSLRQCVVHSADERFWRNF